MTYEEKFKKLITGTENEKMLSKACVLLSGVLKYKPSQIYALLEELQDITPFNNTETVGQIIQRMDLANIE